MRSLLLIPVFVLCSLSLPAQNGTWTWMHGTSANNYLGNFGTIGVPAPSNDPPALYEPATWTDLNGNFWVFGGYSANNMQTALWKYDPVANIWTWMKGITNCMQSGVYGTMGVPSPANYPGSRAYGCVTWTDSQNNLWMFGGHGYDGFNIPGDLNDLWKYNIATNEWTWVNGSANANPTGSYGTLQVPAASNQPPPRCCFSGWTDNNGDLWFFGGYEFNAFQCYSDVWRYNIASNTWTWMSGSSALGAPPDYGIWQVQTPSNTPGGRIAYSYWRDQDGMFWFFGGCDDVDFFSDMWRYDPSVNQWTWMAGTVQPNDTNGFPVRCRADIDHPMRRADNCTNWVDGCGRLLNYGGGFLDGQLAIYCDDIWSFDPGTNLFAWHDGTQIPNQMPNFGTQLVPAPTNHPGGNAGGAGFQDNQGNYWFFGGDLPPNNIQLQNSVWKYTPDTTCALNINNYLLLAPDTVCAGNPAVFGSQLNHPDYTFNWNFGDPLSTGDTSSLNNPSYTFANAGTYTVTYTYSPSLAGCYSPDIDTFTVVVTDPLDGFIFPNVFSPNGDQNNDVFPGFTHGMSGYSLEVFDRWGAKVFSTGNALESWDGKGASEGVYFWTAITADCMGESSRQSGFVHLVR